LAELFDTSKQSISYHIVNILKEGELDVNLVVKEFLTTAADGIITYNKKNLLTGAGSVSNKQMEMIVEKVYEEFNEKRKKYELEQADKEDLEELKMIENEIKNKKVVRLKNDS